MYSRIKLPVYIAIDAIFRGTSTTNFKEQQSIDLIKIELQKKTKNDSQHIARIHTSAS